MAIGKRMVESLQDNRILKPTIETGSWVDDPEFDKVIEELDQIDEELWK